MKCSPLSLLVSVGLLSSAWALPQDFGDLSQLQGALFGGGLGVDGRDLTTEFMAPEVWRGDAELPGNWRDAYEVGPDEVRHITAAPFLFGHVPIGVEAVYHRQELDRVSIYYLESGTFYGYQPGLKDTPEGKKTLQDKQRLFRKVFADLEKSLDGTLGTLTKDRGETLTKGKTSVLKQRFKQYERDGLAVQLRTKKDFYVRVDLRRADAVTPSYLSKDLQAQKKRDRVAALKLNVVKGDDGDVTMRGIPMIYQGGRAYCGITTYLMAAQYLGIQMDPATMASVSGFRHGQGGKKMIEAYTAVAKEGGMRLSRSNKLDVDRVKASVDRGLPVVVWRRYDSKRNRLHMASAKRFPKHDQYSRLPEVSDADRATWPSENAPAHASVITGYQEERNEMIFSESWGEHARGKRMHAEELEATAYYVFYFSL